MSTTIRVSVNSVGNQADDVSQSASISFDGRFVAFESYASNLVTDDNNGVADIFVRDLLNGTTTRLSVDSNEVQSNGPSHRPSISGNGLFVAFESEATNLVSGDEYNVINIFVRDIEAGTTSRVSIANNGDESNWHSSYPSISGDGRFIAFASGATNLVVGDTNGISDIFVHDWQSGTTKIIPFSLAPGATPNMARIPSISANGNVVAFASLYWVLPEHYLSEFITIHNINSGKTNRIECDDVPNPCYLSLSGEGRFVAFQSAFPFVAGDTNSVSDIFVYENEVITNVFLPLLLR
jgi:Tol biopolymer transport system component